MSNDNKQAEKATGDGNVGQKHSRAKVYFNFDVVGDTENVGQNKWRNMATEQ